MTSAEATADRLVQLGFSQYEARAYVGLLGAPPLTGYALSNATGIPQPKVYETLRRLTARGAVIQTGESPARFTAVSPEQLLQHLDADFKRKLSDARDGLARLVPEGDEQVRPVNAVRNRLGVLARAIALLGEAQRHVYLSGHTEDLALLADAVREAADRGVRFEVLYAGDAPFELTHGRLLPHTGDAHDAPCGDEVRHLALAIDATSALWALAPGDDWDCLWAQDTLFATAIHECLRRSICLQRIHMDFGAELAERYGPSRPECATP
ncbi:helix-turn-helix domain-containing protein [Thermopolyspora sp. NPDC052614]|uniref:TrmB family transcriptional regulator n=1 Tax=Thermopolyspora sp. NPDC052614 TaxID=3155682 RepID=UPI003434465D